MTIVYAAAVLVFGALTALNMIQRHARLLRKEEYRAELSLKEAENTKALFAAEEQRQLQQTRHIGMAEEEIAKTKRLEAERKLAQVQLAKETISMFGGYRGDRLLEAHSLTIDGLLCAVARQLDDLPPDPMAIKAANDLARQRAFGEKKEEGEAA